MCGKRNYLGSNQLHLSTFVHRLSAVHSLPRQNSPCLSVYLTTTLADALGLSWDCRCGPGLLRVGNLRKPVELGRSGYH